MLLSDADTLYTILTTHYHPVEHLSVHRVDLQTLAPSSRGQCNDAVHKPAHCSHWQDSYLAGRASNRFWLFQSRTAPSAAPFGIRRTPLAELIAVARG